MAAVFLPSKGSSVYAVQHKYMDYAIGSENTVSELLNRLLKGSPPNLRSATPE